MERQELLDAVAACGLDCMDCPIHERNITDELAGRLSSAYGCVPEKTACGGCRSDARSVLCPAECATLDCSRERGVDFCFECDGFPCDKLHPAADMADKLPHNLKVYNSCRMREKGVERWLKEESRLSAAKYYQGKMIVGKGPVMEEK